MSIRTIEDQDIIKLDLIDKKLLYILSQDLRYPRKTLAKKLNISEQTLHYRIERLIKESIEPMFLINFPLFKIKSYIIFVEYLTDEKVKELEKTKEIYVFCRCVGKYQYLLLIVTNELDEFCKKYFKELLIDIIEVNSFIPDNYNPFNIEENTLPLKKNIEQKLDKKDFKILLELSKSPLDSYLSLSLNSGIDRQTIKLRLEKLYENNYIQKFRFSLNPYKLGFIAYFLKINFSYSIKEELIKKIRSDNFSGFVYLSNGSLIMWYLPPSHKELFKFVNSLEKEIKSIKIEVIQVTDLHNSSWIPDYIVEYFENNSKDI